MFLKALLADKTEGFDGMYQDFVGGGRASIILSRDVGLLRVLCGSQHPASAALQLHQQGGGELTCFFCTYNYKPIYDNKHFFGEHFKFGANYALKEICHQIGGLDLSPVVFSTLPEGW